MQGADLRQRWHEPGSKGHPPAGGGAVLEVVAPVPAWAGRRYGCRRGHSQSCPYARVGRTGGLGRQRDGVGCPCARVGRTISWSSAGGCMKLPLCPRGPDGHVADALAGVEVAPVPAWAGRPCPAGRPPRGLLPLCPRGPDAAPRLHGGLEGRCPCARVGRTTPCVMPTAGGYGCPCARVGRTHGKHWGLTLWKARKCPKVVGGTPHGSR